MLAGQIISALFFVGIALLFIDLVPLQENMMCPGNYTNGTECPEAYFSQTYFDARMKFRDASLAIDGATRSSHTVLEEDNVAYTMDVTVIPGELTDSLLVHVSGTHGVEGFIGSAIQTKMLREWNATSRKAGPTTVFVHAVNPYGFAHYRRFNEHNVDLNRNFFATEAEWNEMRNRDPNLVGYEDFRSMLYPAAVPTLFDRYALLFRAAYHIALNGFVKMKRTLVTGQYHFPEGPYYGGNKEEQSITILKKVLGEYKDKYKHVTVIDVHSGLGPEGVDTLMVSSEQELERAKLVFANSTIEAPGDKAGPNSGYDLTRGGVDYQPMLGDHTIAVTEEFGTIPGVFVARAIILENSACHLAKGSYIHKVTQDWMRDAFYPQKLAFKKSVLKRGGELFESAWKYLQSAN